jgi:signal transduction histidine kinase
MKIYSFLIVGVVLLAFATGYFALSMWGNYSYTYSDVEKIQKIKQAFEYNIPPVSIINFSSFYNSQEAFKLINPIYSMSDKQQEDRYSSSKECFKNLPSLMRNFSFTKVVVWEEFRCGVKKELPETFFSSPPYLHPSGKSYAYLATQLEKMPYSDLSWVRANFFRYHILELIDVEKKYGQLNKLTPILNDMDFSNLSSLSKGAFQIFTKKYILKRVARSSLLSVFDGDRLEYKLYARATFDNLLKRTDYKIGKYRKGHRCFYRDGDICWEYSLKHLIKLANKKNIIFLIISLFAIILVVWILLSRIRNQRQEESRRRLSLQVLTHEFRTPVASMLLLVDMINKKMDSFDEELQDSVIRLSSEVFRLQRLIEGSKHYLKADGHHKLIQPKLESIDSANRFVSMVIDDYIDRVSFNPLEEDISIKLDSYWIMICLKNLIENALIHGVRPIRINLETSNRYLIVSVIDSGMCEELDLSEVTKEFVKGNKSQGSGLGLNIVKKVMDSLDGKLTFQNNPTTFALNIKRKG